jgi:hypothetical protein
MFIWLVLLLLGCSDNKQKLTCAFVGETKNGKR